MMNTIVPTFCISHIKKLPANKNDENSYDEHLSSQYHRDVTLETKPKITCAMISIILFTPTFSMIRLFYSTSHLILVCEKQETW